MSNIVCSGKITNVTSLMYSTNNEYGNNYFKINFLYLPDNFVGYYKGVPIAGAFMSFVYKDNLWLPERQHKFLSDIFGMERNPIERVVDHVYNIDKILLRILENISGNKYVIDDDYFGVWLLNHVAFPITRGLNSKSYATRDGYYYKLNDLGSRYMQALYDIVPGDRVLFAKYNMLLDCLLSVIGHKVVVCSSDVVSDQYVYLPAYFVLSEDNVGFGLSCQNDNKIHRTKSEDSKHSKIAKDIQLINGPKISHNSIRILEGRK